MANKILSASEAASLVARELARRPVTVTSIDAALLFEDFARALDMDVTAFIALCVELAPEDGEQWH